MNYQTIFDSIKVDFEQEDVEDWSDEERETQMSWWSGARRSGLTGKAAAWAVKNQKQHCSVREGYNCNGECKYKHLDFFEILMVPKNALKTAKILVVPKEVWEKYEKSFSDVSSPSKSEFEVSFAQISFIQAQ